MNDSKRELELRKQKRRKKRRRARIISSIVMYVAIVVLAVSAFKLFMIYQDYHKSESTYDSLIGDIVEVEADNEELEDWMLVSIDFDSLCAINSDVVGWILFDDTSEVPINYPILQGVTNDVYLRKNLYGETYTAGSIFLESANASDFTDLYSLIYGHNMKNGSMFGTLKQYKRDEDFYEANQYFTIYTKQAAYRYQIFSYMDVKTDSSLYTVGYAADAIYGNLIDTMVSSSLRDTGIYPETSDHIVVLSTCTSTGSDYRFVVCGVQIDAYYYED